jgi:altronate hydrolase
MAILKIHDADNVGVTTDAVQKGEMLKVGGISISALDDVEKGHKIALKDIPKGDNIIKYGFPIGHATSDIKIGEWAHTHNVKTNLSQILTYEYRPQLKNKVDTKCDMTFAGFRRKDSRPGIRNEIWIIPTVNCVNRIAQLIAQHSLKEFADMKNIDGIYEFTHHYGCSQLGEDMNNTQKFLAGLVNHPNAAGVLVLGLGCENNNVAEFKKAIGTYDAHRVKFLVAQEVDDEVKEGVRLIGELIHYAGKFEREEIPVSELVVGLKCGGSDGFSGITANPLVGAFSDKLVECGGITVLTEVPEMFGAETLLMSRAINHEAFDKIVKLINEFKQYFASYGQPIYENPSPGNKKGGITTLEDKSLGCTQKGGTGNVVDVLGYAETVREKGLNLLKGPGNDLVSISNLAAAGCHMVLFTTGRGTPQGTVVPTIKISTNTDLYNKKANWIDFDAGRLLSGVSMKDMTEELLSYVIRVASGWRTKSEQMGFRDIAIFKTGVIL